MTSVVDSTCDPLKVLLSALRKGLVSGLRESPSVSRRAARTFCSSECQYLHFRTSKASKLSTFLQLRVASTALILLYALC